MTGEAAGVIRLFPGEPGDPDDRQAPACPAGRDDRALTRHLVGLLAEVGHGDRAAFTEFYRATSHRVFGLAVRILRANTAAEEITQEVYLQVWSLAADYDPKLSSPIGWLMMLTHRRAVDRVRSEQSAAGRDVVYGHAHLGRDHDVVSETVTQRSEERAVVDCLRTLTELQREAIALAYYGARSYPEVAQHLGVALPTVKTRIRDGLKRLGVCLTGSDSR